MEALIQLLERVNRLAEILGGWILGAIGLILPIALARDLAVPVGWLALLTAFVALGEAARKIMWIVVGVGWLLMAVRIALLVIRG